MENTDTTDNRPYRMNLLDLDHLDIEHRAHGGSNIVTLPTVERMERLAGEGYRFVVGNNPHPRSGLPYGATKAVKMSQVNHRRHGKSVRTIWAVR